jgi:hypothetical protein
MSDTSGESGRPVPAIPLATLEYQNPNRVEALGTYWREGKTLRIVDGAELPCRCVKCNSSEDVTMKRRTLYWYPKWTFALVLLNILIYFVVSMCVRRKISVTYGLCGRHRRLRVWGIVSGIGGVALGILLMIVAAVSSGPNSPQEWFYLASLIVIVAAIASGLFMAHIFSVELIRNGSAWLRSVSTDFLETL